MPSPIYQYVIDFVVFPSDGPGEFMKGLVWEHHALNNQILYVAKI
jgi:hypothetical protein